MKAAVTLPAEHPVFGSTAVFQSFQYAPGVMASGRLLFVAGQVGIASDGTIPPEAGAQAELAFARLAAIVEAAGGSLADLVDLTTYHVDLPTTLGPVRAVKERWITRDFPAWTIIGAAALARPEFLVEVKAVAALPEGSR